MPRLRPRRCGPVGWRPVPPSRRAPTASPRRPAPATSPPRPGPPRSPRPAARPALPTSPPGRRGPSTEAALGLIERRITLLLALFLGLLALAGARTAYLAAIRAPSLKRVAASQQVRIIDVPA